MYISAAGYSSIFYCRLEKYSFKFDGAAAKGLAFKKDYGRQILCLCSP